MHAWLKIAFSNMSFFKSHSHFSAHKVAEPNEFAQPVQQREWLDRRPAAGGSPDEAAQAASDRFKRHQDDMSKIHEALRRSAERTEGVLARLVSESAEELDARFLEVHSYTGGEYCVTRIETNLLVLMKVIAQKSVESMLEVSEIEEKLVEVIQLILQGRISERTVEQFVDVPVSQSNPRYKLAKK